MRGWRKITGTLVLTIVGVQGLELATRAAPLPAPASRFLEYYEALSGVNDANLWDRVVFSYIMAGSRL
jgi:hypothetical protein